MSGQRLRRRYALLTALRWSSVGLLVPFWILLRLERGLTLAEAGLVTAVYMVTVAVLELPTGGLSDALGRRVVLVAGAAFGIASLAVLLVAQSVWAFAVTAVLHGAERALRSGPLEAWYVDTVRARDEAAPLRQGITAGAVAEGVALGGSAVAGGLLAAAFPGLPHGGSAVLSRLTVPVVAALVVEALYLVAVLALVTEQRARRGPAALRVAVIQVPAVVRAGVALGVRHPAIRLLLLAVAVVGVAQSAVELLWQPRFAELLSGPGVGFGLVSGIGFAAAAAGGLVARQARGNAALPAVGATVAQAAALGALAAAGLAVPAAVAYSLFYLAGGSVWPLHHELLHEHTPAERRATMLSVDSLAGMGGGLVASLALPALAERAGISAAWATAAAALGASALLYLPISRRTAPAGTPARSRRVTAA